MEFNITSEFKPTGDQPEAIRELTEGIERGDRSQVLLGVTGSGKTFTIANVIKNVKKPTLVLSHNKTLAAQLYSEFKKFFPQNAVEFFISYYDYYQPEAYIPVTDTYIEKDVAINDEIEKMRLSATSSLLSGRKDIIVVASVSCIYGIGNPDDFHNNIINISVSEKVNRNKLIHRMVESLYFRTELDLERGKFRVRGDTVDVFPASGDNIVRIEFFGDEIESVSIIDPVTNKQIESVNNFILYPANIFVTSTEKINGAINAIHLDLGKQIEYFKEIGKTLEAKRLEERITYDIEMMKELGYCSGIENYSRYFDGRNKGSRPFCLLDYFPKDFLLIIDESHVTVPQIRAMYGGDRSRKQNLVEFGFRLPSALDNRPLQFFEFETLINQAIFVSATPADYELSQSGGAIAEQLIRPTGLLDPIIEVKPSLNQIDDLLNEIELRTKVKERTLVTTLTKRMAEELTKYLTELEVKCKYIHSNVETLDRVIILHELRSGDIDVIIGVNLLREGLDLPEVSLVAILDADKEGFLRSEKSLTQTAGRAARNINSKVIFYADKITDSMQRTINETARRRFKQMEYNRINNITPTPIIKEISNESNLFQTVEYKKPLYAYTEEIEVETAADPIAKYFNKDQLKQLIANSKKEMEKAAKEMDFIEAARHRDDMYKYQKLLAD